MYIEQIIHDNEMNGWRKSPHSSSAWLRMILGSSWICCMVASPSNSLDLLSFLLLGVFLWSILDMFILLFLSPMLHSKSWCNGGLQCEFIRTFFYLKTKCKNSFKRLIHKIAVFDFNYLTLYCKSNTLPCIRPLARSGLGIVASSSTGLIYDTWWRFIGSTL